MSENKAVTEGRVIVGGLLIFMLCLAGSVVTRQSPIVVFCAGVLAITLTVTIGGLFIIACVRFYKIMEEMRSEDSKMQMRQGGDDWVKLRQKEERDKEESKAQMLREAEAEAEDYDWLGFRQDYKIPDSHTKEGVETGFLAKCRDLTSELKGYLKYFWSRVQKQKR